jgi:concanavalin A-like lectin/glucanase superfamily protein
MMRRYLNAFFGLLISLLIASPGSAQYQPIPNFTGVGAGQQFRQSVNNRLSGASPIAPAIVTIYYSQLPAETNGAIYYLRDGVAGVPCTGGGSGAFAIGINGSWSCTAGATAGSGGGVANPLTAALNFNAFKGTGAAADTATGDVLSRNQSTLNSLAAPTASYGMNSQVLTGVGYGQQFQARQGGAAVVSNSSTTGNAASVSLSPPSGIVNGNALIAMVALQGNATQTVTWPSGFVQTTNSQVVQGTNVQAVACKIASSESGNYSVSWTNSVFFAAAMVQVSGISCTGDGVTSVGSSSAASITVPGVAVAQTNDFLLDFADYAGGFPHDNIGGHGAIIWHQNNNGIATSYVNPAGTTPTSTFTDPAGGGQSFLGEQIAFQSSSTLTQVPMLQSGSGNTLQDLTAHVNGVLDVKAPPYSAACDGNTDDSAAIQKALNDGCTQGKAVELPTGTCRTTVPLFDACANPAEFSGRSESSSIISAYFNGGPVVVESNPTADVSIVGPITTTSHLGGGVALCWDGTGTPCGAATGTSPGQYVYDVKDWTDNAGGGGIQATNPLNGLAAGNLTVEFEGNVPTGAAGAYLTDSASGVTGAAGHDLFISIDGTNHLFVRINSGGTMNTISSTGWSFSAWHHGALVFDNHSGNSCTTTNCLRLYIDGVQTAALDVTGNIVQPTYDTWVLGGDAGHFPNSGANTAYWDGMVDYFRVEKADLYPSGTTFTPPSSKPAGDSNTIVLVNADLPATISGFGSTIAANGVIGADATAGDGLSNPPGVPCASSKCGAWAYLHAAPLAAGGTVSHRVHDMTISNGGESLFGNVAIQFHPRNLTLTANHVPFKCQNNCYEMMAENIVATTSGEAAMELAHNSGFVAATGILLNNGTAGQLACYDQSCGLFNGLFMQPQLGSSLFDTYFGEDSIFTSFTCIDCLVDSENGAPTVATGWFEGGEPTLIGGDWQSLASGNPPSIQLTAGTTLSAFGTHFEGGAATAPIFHFIGSAPMATSPHVRLDNVVLNGAQPYDQADLISDQPGFVDIAGGNFSLLTGYTGFKNGVDKLTVNSLADPATPSATLVGSTGSTSYGPYYVVCHGVGGSTTMQSVGSNTVTNGPASLNVSNYITIAWTAEAGCATWDVLRGSLSTSIATGLNASLTSFNDTGISTSAYTAPARNTTGDVSGGLFISSGTTFVNLPATVINGARRYCSNCDPPANPPVACTSSSTRTGAMAEGINGSWICAY